MNTADFSGVPDNLIEKAHAVCIRDSKLLIVLHPEWDIWSIPGGSRDEGESILETLHREVLEETNCKVVSEQPIALQKIQADTGDLYYRALYLCEVESQGDFVEDIAGNITEIKWIDLNEYEDYIEENLMKLEVVKEGIRVHGEER